MERFKVIMSVVILIASISIMFNQLFTPQSIQIILETGQEVETQTSDFFSLTQVMLLVVSAFAIGSTSIYLYFKSETDEFLKAIKNTKEVDKRYEMVLPLLNKDEKAVFSEVMDSDGGMLQNKLVLKTSLNKVKMTRTLASLEKKKLIVKERHGLTNRIKLK